MTHASIAADALRAAHLATITLTEAGRRLVNKSVRSMDAGVRFCQHVYAGERNEAAKVLRTCRTLTGALLVRASVDWDAADAYRDDKVIAIVRKGVAIAWLNEPEETSETGGSPRWWALRAAELIADGTKMLAVQDDGAL